MSLPWVRLDTGFPRNLKILSLAEDRQWQAITGYVCGLAYAGEQGTDGFIARGALPFIHATPRTAAQLVEVGLWVTAGGGWEINDWREYQPSPEANARRSDHARVAAQKRWSRSLSRVKSVNGQATDV